MITLDDIRRAAESVYRVAHRTPALHSLNFSEMFGAPIYLKAECLQHTGSFKVRGAANKIATLTIEERARGVIAASAGNHAQGVAVAASAAGVAATVVMPQTAPLSKVEATKGYGATVVLHGSGFGEAAKLAAKLTREQGLVSIPAFDDDAVIAGQGTVGLELADQIPDAGLVLVPVGGGGLAAGLAVAVKSLRSGVTVVGVQAAAAVGAQRSYQGDSRTTVDPGRTIADGVAVPAPGRQTLPILRRYLDDIVSVDEESIVHAIVLLLERTKLVVEGAGALGIAALLSGSVKANGRPTVAVLSGGNVDMNLLATIVQHGLSEQGRYLTLTVLLEDRPGELAALLAIIARTGANLLDVAHHRHGVHMPLGAVAVRLLVETRGREHLGELIEQLHAAGLVEARADPSGRVFGPAAWA